MSMQTSRQWRCDRCQQISETSLTEQPSGWGSALVWEPPLMDPNEAMTADRGEERRHLCRNCVRAVREFILTAPGNPA